MNWQTFPSILFFRNMGQRLCRTDGLLVGVVEITRSAIAKPPSRAPRKTTLYGI